MAIVEIIVILGIYTYILLRVPQFRLAGGVVAVALLGGLVYYFLASEPEKQAELNRIPVEQATLSDLGLEMGIQNSTLTGRIVNGSDDSQIIGVLLTVTIYDCPAADSDLADCFIIGQDDGEARVKVPAGQLRDFKATFLFASLPEITGEFRWEHEIIALRALAN